jgi:hypothetical protein
MIKAQRRTENYITEVASASKLNQITLELLPLESHDLQREELST